jgi:SagB-type dehydrogenase family enzyme
MPEASHSIAQYYHQRTKYAPETLATKARPLNWDEQPVPYKDYRYGTYLDLKPYLDVAQATNAATPDNLWWQRLSQFLINSYGLTAKILTTSGEPFYLRAAPSAGGLYPAELYLISRGTSALPPGLYNYQARTHSLLRFWDDHPWPALQSACFWHPSLVNTQLALVITAVFQRSAWRYQARAYRRILLDTGHLLGNLDLAGSLCDYRPHLMGGFMDEAINQLLYLDTDQEGAIATVALADLLEVEQNLPIACTALPGPVDTTYANLDDETLLRYLHQVTQIPSTHDFTPQQQTKPAAEPETNRTPPDKYNLPFGNKIPMRTSPILWGKGLESLETAILSRRSTRRYTGGEIPLPLLQQVLDFTYHPEHYADQGLERHPDYFDLSLIETFVVASGVTTLDPGCYYYAPHSQELRQIRFKQFRSELHYLCLGQELGRDASAIIFHTADLAKAIERYGDRAYRYLHMDAGHLGQRLNLAATHLNLGVSGIAGFFDDQVNDVLGIPEDEAVLYLTTLGMPWQVGND